MLIYIHRDGQTFGPYSVEQVRESVASGDIKASDLACVEGGTEWIPLGELPGISSATLAKPPAQPDWVPQRRSDRSALPVNQPVQKQAFVAAKPAKPKPSPEPIWSSASDPEDAPRKKKTLSPIEERRRRQKEMGKQLMVFGALAFIPGAGASLLTFFMAVGAGGGIFIVFFGLITTGAILFVAGYKQYTGA